jgi:hypothetical protein
MVLFLPRSSRGDLLTRLRIVVVVVVIVVVVIIVAIIVVISGRCPLNGANEQQKGAAVTLLLLYCRLPLYHVTRMSIGYRSEAAMARGYEMIPFDLIPPNDPKATCLPELMKGYISANNNMGLTFCNDMSQNGWTAAVNAATRAGSVLFPPRQKAERSIRFDSNELPRNGVHDGGGPHDRCCFIVGIMRTHYTLRNEMIDRCYRKNESPDDSIGYGRSIRLAKGR